MCILLMLEISLETSNAATISGDIGMASMWNSLSNRNAIDSPRDCLWTSMRNWHQYRSHRVLTVRHESVVVTLLIAHLYLKDA